MLAGLALFVAVGSGVSCRSLPPLPATDLSLPGWQVMQGQAVWRPMKSRPELAGELLVATRPGGDLFVQFAKDPFPLVIARAAADGWQIEFGAGHYSWRGRGARPTRFAWFELTRALGGEVPDRGWKFERLPTNSWRLENRRTGERLEGYLCP